MKIAIVVQGRFHAFHLARALLKRGHDVTLMTNYPKWAVVRWGFPKPRTHSFWVHGLLQRFVEGTRFPAGEGALHRLFGRWAARRLWRQPWDVVHIWSGVAEEALRELQGSKARTMLMRGSAHIRAQARLLEAEEARAGVALDRPGPWIRAREEREYEAADEIVVLSSFSHRTFVEEGVAAHKLKLLPLAADLDVFHPTPTVIESRCARILSGAQLRVLYVGTLSYQKGMLDLATIAHDSRTARFDFRLVGAVAPEARRLVEDLPDRCEVVGVRPERDLPDAYAWGDVFVYPSIQDGYAIVLAQAQAAGLPIVTTLNCSGPDLIAEGETGWVLPIRDSAGIVQRLLWCDEHRHELAAMARSIYERHMPRGWDDVAADFERICAEGHTRAS